MLKEESSEQHRTVKNKSSNFNMKTLLKI